MCHINKLINNLGGNTKYLQYFGTNVVKVKVEYQGKILAYAFGNFSLKVLVFGFPLKMSCMVTHQPNMHIFFILNSNEKKNLLSGEKREEVMKNTLKCHITFIVSLWKGTKVLWALQRPMPILFVLGSHSSPPAILHVLIKNCTLKCHLTKRYHHLHQHFPSQPPFHPEPPHGALLKRWSSHIWEAAAYFSVTPLHLSPLPCLPSPFCSPCAPGLKLKNNKNAHFCPALPSWLSVIAPRSTKYFLTVHWGTVTLSLAFLVVAFFLCWWFKNIILSYGCISFECKSL